MSAIGLCFVLVVGGIVGLAMFAANSDEFISDVAVTGPAVEIEPEMQQQINVRLLNGDWLEPADTTQREAVEFLAELEKTSAEQGQAAFMELVDFDAHLTRYYDSYRFDLDYSTRRQIRNFEFEGFDMPEYSSDFRVAAIERVSPRDLMVYAYSRQGEVANAAYVFHLRVGNGEEYQLVDWREIGEGIWAAELNGLSVGPMLSDTQRFSQEAMYEDLNEADRQIEAREYQAAEESLRRAEARGTLFRLHDRSLHLIALRWFWMNRLEDAMRLCNEAHSPAGYPWIDYLKADIYSRQREHEKTLDSIARYEQNAGFHYDLAETKLRALTALEQNKQAAETALQMLAHLPDSRSSLTAALRYVPTERLNEVFAYCSGDAENLAMLTSISSSLLYDGNTESHAALRAFVAEKAPGSHRLAEIDGHRFYYEGQFEKSLAAYQKRMQLLKDDELAANALHDYLSAAVQIMSWKEIYQAVDSPALLMQTLYYDVAYDQEYVSPKSFVELVALHKTKHSEDPHVAAYETWAASHNEVWAKVIELGESALIKEKAAGADEYELNEIEGKIAEARYRLDQWQTAYEAATDREQAYLNFASRMMLNEDFESLAKLNELHGQKQGGLLLSFYKLRVAEHRAAEANDSKTLARVLEDYQILHSKCEGSDELSPYTVATRIDHLIVHSDDWRTLFADSEQGGQLFYQFVRRFKGAGDLPALNEFLTMFVERYPDDPAFYTYYAQFNWRYKQHEKVIDALSPWPPETTSAYNAPVYTWRPLRIKSQLAMDDIAGAKATLDPTLPGDRLELMVHMAGGETDRVEEILADTNTSALARLSIPMHNDWLRGQRMKRFIASDAFAELREKFPPTIAVPVIEKRAVIFFNEAPTWSVETMEANFERAEVDAVKITELTAGDMVSKTFRLNSFTSELLLTVGDDRFTVDENSYYGQSLPKALKKVVDSHSSWATIETVGDSAALTHDKFTQIIAAFTQTANGVHVSYTGDVDRWIVFGDELAPDDRTAGFLLDNLKGVATAWMPFANTQPYDHQKTIALNKRLQSPAELNAIHEAKIHIRHGSAVEAHWCTIEKAEHENWGSYKFIGRLQANSQLIPQWKKGDAVELRNYDILEWRD